MVGSAITRLVAKIVRYKGQILWDKTKPNGTPRKLLDVTKTKNWVGRIKQN